MHRGGKSWNHFVVLLKNSNDLKDFVFFRIEITHDYTSTTINKFCIKVTNKNNKTL